MSSSSLPSAALALLLASSPCAASAQSGTGATPAQLHASLRSACVEVMVDKRLNGSGWLAPEPGFAFTASHVVPRMKASVAVRMADGRLVVAKVKARDPGHDALLLELADKTNLPAGLPLVAAPPAAGDEVFLFGAPIFRHAVFLPGRVAREGAAFEWLGDQREGVECVHVAASTPKGVSGGPWINRQGEVVGVQSGLMEQGGAPAGIGWFGPAAALARLLATKQDTPTPTLGVAFEEIEEQSMETIRGYPPGAVGIVLKVITKDGPAEAAKLPAGCLAVSIDGEHPATRDAAYRLVRSRPVGKKIEVRYFEPGGKKEASAEVVVGPWKEAS